MTLARTLPPGLTRTPYLSLPRLLLLTLALPLPLSLLPSLAQALTWARA